MKRLLILILFLVCVSSTYAVDADSVMVGNVQGLSFDTRDYSAPTMIDMAGNTNATNVGTATTGQAGHINESFLLDGTSDLIDTNYIANTGSYTILIWIKATDTASTIIDNTPSASSSGFLFLGGATNTGFYHATTPGSWDIHNQASSGIYDGNWHMLAQTYNATTSTIARYLDNVSIDSVGSAAYTPNTVNDIYLGERRNFPGTKLQGNLDEYYVWNRALTLTEIKFMYNLTTDLYHTVPPGPSSPVVSNTWTIPNATTNYVNTNISFDWGNCTSGTGSYTYYFYLNDTLQYSGLHSNWTSGFTVQQNYTYNYYCTDTNNLSSDNSTQRWIIYDYSKPQISNIVKPTSTTLLTDYFNFTLTDNIGLYQYELNFTYNSNGTQIGYVKNTTLTGTNENISYTLDHTGLPFGMYTVKLNFSDTHTDSIFNRLDWKYSNGEITFYNPNDVTEEINIDFGYYSNNEVHKITTQQIQDYNVVRVVDKKRDRYEFGATFNLPNTNFIFGFRIPKDSQMKLQDPDNLNFIMYDKYWMDFETYFGKNGIYKKFKAQMKQDANYYYVYYNIDWATYNVQAGDRITFVTRSIGGLNFNSYEFDYYYVASDIPVFQYGKLNSFSNTSINWTIDLLILNNKTTALTVNVTPDSNLGSYFTETIPAYGYYKKSYNNITSLSNSNRWLNFTAFTVNHDFGGLIQTSNNLSLITPSNGTGTGGGQELISCISTIGPGCGVSFTNNCAVIS